MDIILSLVALVFLFPLLAITALSIYIEDGGPLVFRQERIGKNGEKFQLFKFRSMSLNAGDIPSAMAYTLKITRIGHLIRRTNIDELPQLINILLGDMSIVGSRPALSSQKQLIDLRRENGVLEYRPGLSGLAQINSYDGMTDQEKAYFDSLYISKVTFFGDVKIILKTFLYLLKPPPIY